MTTIDLTGAVSHPQPSAPLRLADLSTRSVAGRRRLTNRAMTALMWLAVLVAIVPLGYLLVSVVVKGVGVIGWDWFTKDIPTSFPSAERAAKYGAEGPFPSFRIVYGMAPAIYGTLLTTALASALAIPTGVLAAIYLNEYGRKGRLARVLRFFSDVMTGVPSVVMGVFVYLVIVLQWKERSALAGGLALACLMLPVVVRSTEEMLKLVPNSLRDAAAGLGTPTWRTTLTVVLPAALPGVTSGCMLAVARAAGETAPLLFTIGSVSAINWSVVGPNTALSTQIYSNVSTPGAEGMAWGAALTLIVLVLVLTVAARWITSKFSFRLD